MQEYEQVVHGSADRIIRVHESQTVQVANREDRIVDAQIDRDRDGQGWAGFLSLLCVAAGIVFGFTGRISAMAIVLGLPVVMLVGSFIPRSGRQHDQSD